MIHTRVTLTYQTPTEVINSDGIGGITTTWATTGTVTGYLQGDSGKEDLGAGRMEVYMTHMFYCNMPVDFTLDEKGQFLYGTRTFDIVRILDYTSLGKKLHIQLLEIK